MTHLLNNDGFHQEAPLTEAAPNQNKQPISVFDSKLRRALADFYSRSKQKRPSSGQILNKKVDSISICGLVTVNIE